MNIQNFVQFKSGSPLFRIDDTPNARVYELYDQTDLAADFTVLFQQNNDKRKQVLTDDAVSLLAEGDVIFSLISGTAARVCAPHAGFLYSHNYVVITPNEELNADFLVYLLNQNQDIRRQFSASMQGSSVMKYTLRQLRALELKPLPPLAIQAAIGRLDRLMRRLAMLKKRVADNEQLLLARQLEKLMNAQQTK